MQRLRQWTAHTHNRNILTNVLWLFLDNALRLVAGIVVSAWIARYLGVDDYGRLKSVVTLLLMFQATLRLGLDEVLVREYIKRPDERPALLSSGLALRLALSALAIPLMPAVMRLLKPEEPLLAELMTIAAVSVLFLAFEVIDYRFQAVVRAKYAVWARNAALLGASAVRIGMIIAGAPLVWFVVMVVGEYALLALALVIIYIRTQDAPHFGPVKWPIMAQLLRDGWPMILTGLAVTAFMRVDQLMLVRMLPPDVYSTEVGLYAAAASLSEVWFFVPVSILNSLFQSIVAAYEQDTAAYAQRLQRTMRFLMLISLAFALSVTLLRRPIIGVLFGPDYAPSAALLGILVWSSAFISMSNMWARVMTIENHIRYTALVTTVGAVANFALNLWLIPRMGATGSAIATVISYAVVGYGGAFFAPASVPLGQMQTRAILWPNPFTER